MTEPADPLQEAVNALLTKGHTVEAIGDDFALWLVDGEAPFSDNELVAYACTLGLIDPPTVMQRLADAGEAAPRPTVENGPSAALLPSGTCYPYSERRLLPDS